MVVLVACQTAALKSEGLESLTRTACWRRSYRGSGDLQGCAEKQHALMKLALALGSKQDGKTCSCCELAMATELQFHHVQRRSDRSGEKQARST